MIRLFFTKVSHYSRSIEEQREQKAILKKQKRCQSALGKGGRLEGNLTGIDSRARPKGGRNAAAEKRKRKRGVPLFLTDDQADGPARRGGCTGLGKKELFLLEHFLFETRYIPNHAACRFVKKTQLFPRIGEAAGVPFTHCGEHLQGTVRTKDLFQDGSRNL